MKALIALEVSTQWRTLRPVTIITGGTRGIGAATAIRLARGGHDLTLAYRQDDDAAEQVAAQVQAAGARCVLAKADVTRQDDVEELFSITAKQLGTVTGLGATPVSLPTSVIWPTPPFM